MSFSRVSGKGRGRLGVVGSEGGDVTLDRRFGAGSFEYVIEI